MIDDLEKEMKAAASDCKDCDADDCNYMQCFLAGVEFALKNYNRFPKKDFVTVHVNTPIQHFDFGEAIFICPKCMKYRETFHECCKE